MAADDRKAVMRISASTRSPIATGNSSPDPEVSPVIESLQSLGVDEKGSSTHYCLSAEFVPNSGKKKKSSNRNKEAVIEEETTCDVQNVSTGEDTWILGSACTYHMCTDRSWFSKYEDFSEGSVMMANGKMCKIVGIGDVKIKMFDGVARTVTDVRYVPDFKHNMISIGALTDRGYTAIGGGGSLEVMKGAKIIIKGQRSPDNLYRVIGSTVTGGASI